MRYLIVLILGVSGCYTPLNKAQHQVLNTRHDVDKVFLTSLEIHQAEMDKMMHNHFQNEKIKLEVAFNQWIAEQTVDGKINSFDLIKALKTKSDTLLKIEGDRQRWELLNQRHMQNLNNFSVLAETNWQNAKEVQKAMESAQYLLDSSLTAIAGAAAGVVVAP